MHRALWWSVRWGRFLMSGVPLYSRPGHSKLIRSALCGSWKRDFDIRLPEKGRYKATWKRELDIRLPGQGNSNSHGARPVY